MRLAHTADNHLDRVQYTRLSKDGRNQRAVDIEQSFQSAVTAIIAERPDAVVICGDIFDVVRPSNHTINFALRQFARLREELPGVPVVATLGNHEEPRTSGVGCIVPALREVGVFVAQRPERFRFPGLGLSVLAVPESFSTSTTFVSEPGFKYNVLAVHGEVRGVIPGTPVSEKNFDAAALNAAQWDVVCLGHYHEYTEVAPRVFYSGATDYTNSNVWAEARSAVPKGFLVHDLDEHSHRLVPLAGLRPHFDLPAIDGRGMSPADIDARIAENAASIAIDGAVVRQVLEGAELSVRRALDIKAIRKLKGRALHYQLDTRKPEEVRVLTSGNVVQVDDDYADGELFADDCEPAGSYDTSAMPWLDYGYTGPAVKDESFMALFDGMSDPYAETTTNNEAAA